MHRGLINHSYFGLQLVIQIREGLHYNPYFPGGAIAMPKMLNDGAVEYEDGTPATEAQVGHVLLYVPVLLQQLCLSIRYYICI